MNLLKFAIINLIISAVCFVWARFLNYPQVILPLAGQVWVMASGFATLCEMTKKSRRLR